MFVPVEWDLTKAAKPGKHILAVCVKPPPKSTCNHYFDGFIPPRSHHHKMQCSWGWDWSRPMVAMGIWDGVAIRSTGPDRVRDVFVQARPHGLSGLRQATAHAEIVIQIDTELKSKNAELYVQIFDPAGQQVHSIRLPARKTVTHSLQLADARLWWPNGYGEQPIYRYRVELGGRDVSDAAEGTFGVRQIRMLPNEGREKGSYDLTFEVNAVKIFALGGNWAPPDLLPARIDRKRYELFLHKAKDLGFNMLRIWGGGLIEKKAFYDLADELGLLIWQEFQLSCSDYPKDKAFLEAKEIEAEVIVKKLRNHPCIALWCGGNEMQYYGMKPDHPVLKLFGKIVRRLHPGIDYHVSSPDKSRPGERDHGPWTWQEHKDWNNHFRQFLSEFGCNGPAPLDSLKQFIPPDQLWPQGPACNHHYVEVESYGGAHQFKPKTLEEWIYYGQICQADQLSYVYGLARTRQFRTSGALIWAYNSAWPEGAWGIVDYYGREKPACDALRQACRPVAFAVLDDSWRLPKNKNPKWALWLINGFPEPLEGAVIWQIAETTGRVLASGQCEVRFDGYQTRCVEEIRVPRKKITRDVLVKATFTGSEQSAVFQRLYWA